MDQALKILLLQTINNMYLDRIYAVPVDFAIYSTQDIFVYLYLIYELVTPLGIKENDMVIQKPYNKANQIKIMHKQIDNIHIVFIATRSPYTMKHMVNITEVEIITIGVHDIGYCK